MTLPYLLKEDIASMMSLGQNMEGSLLKRGFVCLLISKQTGIKLPAVQFSCTAVFDSIWPHELQMPGLPVNHQLPELTKFMYIESVMPFSHLILCHPLLLLPSIFPSIRVFSNESALCIKWAEYWSFSFNISPSNEYSGLISFRMDRLDLLEVQGTLKSLL